MKIKVCNIVRLHRAIGTFYKILKWETLYLFISNGSPASKMSHQLWV